MIRVYVEDNDLFGPIAHSIKGLRKGAETLLRNIDDNLCYLADGALTVDWSNLGLHPKLQQRVILIQRS